MEKGFLRHIGLLHHRRCTGILRQDADAGLSRRNKLFIGGIIPELSRASGQRSRCIRFLIRKHTGVVHLRIAVPAGAVFLGKEGELILSIRVCITGINFFHRLLRIIAQKLIIKLHEQLRLCYAVFLLS